MLAGQKASTQEESQAGGISLDAVTSSSESTAQSLAMQGLLSVCVCFYAGLPMTALTTVSEHRGVHCTLEQDCIYCTATEASCTQHKWCRVTEYIYFSTGLESNFLIFVLFFE